MVIVGYSKRNFKNEKGEDIVYYKVSCLSPVSTTNSSAYGHDASYFSLGTAKFDKLAESIKYAIETCVEVKLLFNRWGKVESIEI